jgi:hypothetical protein
MHMSTLNMLFLLYVSLALDNIQHHDEAAVEFVMNQHCRMSLTLARKELV